MNWDICEITEALCPKTRLAKSREDKRPEILGIVFGETLAETTIVHSLCTGVRSRRGSLCYFLPGLKYRFLISDLVFFAKSSCRSFTILLTVRICLTKALSVLTFAFLTPPTEGPIHVINANFALLLSSSPVVTLTYAKTLSSSVGKENRR